MRERLLLLPLATGLHGLRHVVFFLFHSVSAEQVWQALRERRARHDRVAAGFDGLHLQVALKMIEETYNRCRLLQLRL